MHGKASMGVQIAGMTAIAAGCATAPSREVTLHEASGVTWASMDEAVVLARATPQYALAARDYIYIGPVETNRLGTLEHHLWLGVASTVDRELRGDVAPDSSTLVLVVDGSPIALPLTEWDAEFEAAPYEAQVPVRSSRAARVSLDQIRRIAEADSVEVQIVPAGGSPAPYVLWHGSWQSWTSFPAERVEASVDARLQRP